MVKSILVAIDGSNDANAAVGLATNIAQKEQATVHFLYVLKKANVPVSVKRKIDWAPYVEHYKEVGTQILNAARDKAKKNGIKSVQTELAEGDPTEKILNCAKDFGAELLVIGARGKGFPGRAGLGTVSRKVSEDAECNCLIARRQMLEGKKILIVDDEPDVLATLEELLAMCEVTKAASFEEARTLLEAQRFDMAVLDIMGVDGYKLLDIANQKNVPAVMLTAHALSLEDTMKSFKKGAASYVPKDKMVNISMFLEDVLKAKEQGRHYWWRWFDRLGAYYAKHF